MKTSLISLVVLITLVPSLCTVSVQLLSSSNYIAGGSQIDILFQENDLQLLYHKNDGLLSSSLLTYDTSSGSQTSWVANYPCEYLDKGIFVTEQNNLYCFGYDNQITRKGVAIHWLNPSGTVLNRVSKTYGCSGCVADSIQVTNDGVAIVENENGLNVFYPSSGKLGCLFAVYSEYSNFVYTATLSNVLSGGVDFNTQTYFVGLLSCTTNDLLASTSFVYKQYSTSNVTHQYVNVYNDSTVGLSVVTLGKGVAILTPVNLNTNQFGTNAIFNNFAGFYWKVNDTFFAMLTYHQSFITVGLYYVNANLEVIQAATFNLNYFDVHAIDNIPNSNNVVIYPKINPCDTLEYVVLDLTTFKIVDFFVENTPIFFNNGSVVYYSCQGYYVTNVNRNSTTFVNLPSSQYLVYPSNYNIVYGFYTSNATKSVAGCYITVFNASSSSIVVNLLDSCPCEYCIDTAPGLFVYDVSLNNQKQPCVTYQTGLGGIYVIDSLSLHQTKIYGEGGDLVFPDYNSGIIRVWVGAGQDSTVETFSYLNSTQLNSTHVAFNPYATFKLDQQNVFIEEQTKTDEASYSVYNVVLNTTTYHVAAKDTLYTPTNAEPNAAVFGYNSSSQSMSGFAVTVKGGKGEDIRVHGASGDFTEIEFKSDVNVTAASNSIFQVVDFNATVIGTQYLYSIQSLSNYNIEY